MFEGIPAPPSLLLASRAKKDSIAVVPLIHPTYTHSRVKVQSSSHSHSLQLSASNYFQFVELISLKLHSFSLLGLCSENQALRSEDRVKDYQCRFDIQDIAPGTKGLEQVHLSRRHTGKGIAQAPHRYRTSRRLTQPQKLRNAHSISVRAQHLKYREAHQDRLAHESATLA